MRILAIGDIHGCTTALDALLEAVQLQPGDQLIFLGDYVDRGPDSMGAIDRVLALGNTYPLVALRGNHEKMMLDARDSPDKEKDWLVFGGDAALKSYAVLGDAGKLVDVPDRHWDFLERTVLWHEIDTHFFVHANAYADLPLADQPEYMLLWEKLEGARRHESGKIMVCGHTPQKSGKPLNLGHAICIDTYVYGDGWLTCLDVKSGQVWQANQRRENRHFALSQS